MTLRDLLSNWDSFMTITYNIWFKQKQLFCLININRNLNQKEN